MSAKPPNYDYTASQRSARARERAALVLPAIRLDAEHAQMLERVSRPGESRTEVVRRLIREACSSA